MSALLIGAVALNVYATLLVLVRALVYRTRLYRPMLWNILLSVAPVVILCFAILAWLLTTLISRSLGYVVITVLGLVWLLMLPNASYLITELNQSHRREEDPVPLWYDIILTVTLAMSGVVNTVVNVFAAHTLLTITLYSGGTVDYLRPLVLIAVGGVMLLLGLGMYLGRYLRLNSWDVRHPASFLRKVWRHFRERGNLLACLGFTVTYAVFLALIYLIVAGPLIEMMVVFESFRGLTGL